MVVSKFSDHLPLYRLEDISSRHGLYLSRSTLCDWVRNIADLLKSLYELQKELVCKGPVIWTDDTPVTVLGGENGGSHKGRFWVYIEARSSSPADASLILEIIRRLYEVEDRARPLDDDERRALRQAEAVPILERLRQELDRLSSRLLPKSGLCTR